MAHATRNGVVLAETSRPVIIAGRRRILGTREAAGCPGHHRRRPRLEMIHEPALAVRAGMFAGRLAQIVHAHPTWSLAIQQAAAHSFGRYGSRTARQPSLACAESRPVSLMLARENRQWHAAAPAGRA